MDNPELSPTSASSQRAPSFPKETIPARHRSRIFLTLTLSLIIGLAAHLRLTGLGDESFWFDEGATMAYTGLPFTKMIVYIATRDTHPPFYYILIKFWRNLGDSETFLRLPSAIFGIAAVAYMWSLMKEHWGAAAATGSSFLLAVSGEAIWYSQENRMYSLVLLLMVLFLRCFLRFVVLFQCTGEDGQGNPAPRATLRDCLGVTVFTLALLYTHSMTIFLWGTQLLLGGLLGLMPIVRSRRRRSSDDSGNPVFRNIAFRQWVLCQVVIGVLYLPWLMVLFGQSARVHTRFWTIRPSFEAVWDVLGFTLLWGTWRIPILWDTLKLVVLLVAVRTVWNFRDVKGLTLGAFVVLPLLMSYLYSIFRTPIMINHALIFLCIPMLALAGSFLRIPDTKASVAKLCVVALRVAAGVGIFGFLVFINLSTWRVELGLQSKEDFRSVASNALKFADGATAVVFNNSFSQAAFDYYFHRSYEGRNVDEYGVPCNYLEVPEGNASPEPLVTQESVRVLDKKLSAYQRVVFVKTHGWYTDPSDLLQDYFDSNWQFDQTFAVKKIILLIYTRHYDQPPGFGPPVP